MNDIRPPRRAELRHSGRPFSAPTPRQASYQPASTPFKAPAGSAVPARKNVTVTIHFQGPKRFIESTLKSSQLRKARANFRRYTRSTKQRAVLYSLVFLLAFSVLFPLLQNKLEHKAYALSAGESSVLMPTNKSMAKLLTYDGTQGIYNFNKGYEPGSSADEIKAGGALVTAKIYEDPTKGVTLTDPTNKIDFTMKPLFELGSGKQDHNRVIFPAFNGGGHLIYTAQSVGVKQDVTLAHYVGDNLSYDYELELGDSFAARLQSDGSVGIFGSSLPLDGNVSTGDAKDAALLQKARQKAPKTKLLFSLPAPIIKEAGGHTSDVQVKFELHGSKLTVVASKLKDAAYPLTIDPTVTALSATQFYFDANLETNVNVDTTNNLFERAPLTGGNLLAWNASTSTAVIHFLGGAVVYGGTLYVIGGTAGTTTTNISNGVNSHLIEQAKIASNGSVGAFSDGNYSGLPAGGISRFQLLAYNGYLYIIDGSATDTTGATLSNAIYYTRVTSESYAAFANGAQLVNWSSTTTNVPATARYDYGATVYNGYLYIAGGRTTTAYSTGTNLLTNVSYSPLLPSGAPGAWTSTTSLTAAVFGIDMQPYKGRLYVIGGNLGGGAAGGSLTSAVYYASINSSTGAIADSAWKQTNSLVDTTGATTQAMENLGSTYTMAYNGFIYMTGGCTAINANQSCTAVASYAQLAQVNADGSLGTWFPNDFPSTGTTALPRTGTPTVGYNGNLYSVAGCAAMNAASVSCAATTASATNYVSVNTTVGDISANRNPTALPVGLYGHTSVVLNGYVYVLGGCLTVSCNGNKAANYTTYYAAIAADGSLGSWTNNTVSTNSTSLRFDRAVTSDCTSATSHCGVAGAAAVTYNGYIYVVGGNDGGAYSDAVYYMQPNSSTGATTAWTKSGNLIDTAVTELGAITHNGSLYTVGGCDGTTGIGCSTYENQVQRSILSTSTGAPGVFTNTGNNTNGTAQLQLPAAGRSAFGITYYGGFIYLAGGIQNGGTNSDNQLATVVRAKINAAGDIVAATGTVWTAVTGTMSQPRRRAVAYVVNGYLYVIGGHNAADTTGPPGGANGTTYGDIQIGKIDLSTGGTGNITSFTKSSTSTLTARWNPAVAFGNGFMYVTGGCTAGPPPTGCTTIGTTDESFVVYNADNLGINTWNNQSNVYTTNRLGAGTAVHNGYLYVAGGCTTFTVSGLSCAVATNTVAYAPIGADGTLGTWVSGGTFTTGTAFGQLMAQNGYLYYIGGQTGIAFTTAVATVYKSTIGAAGAPGTFSTTSQTALPAAAGRTQASAVTYAGFIFLAGGDTGATNTSASNVSAVYHSTINGTGDITAWTATTSSFTTARRELSLVSSGAYLFVLGGFDGTNYYSDVQVATPDTSTGDITSWTFDNSLPYVEAGMSAAGANGFIYTFGGRNGVASTSCNNDTNVAAVNGNGTVSDWQQPANVLTTARFGAGVGYSNGYFYEIGGDNCTNIIDGTSGTRVIEQGGQLSQAIHATYTRYVDFGTDATLRQLYVLGSNAAISGNDIDIWNVVIKTSTDANNAWGQKYTTSLTGLGTGPAYGTAITFPSLDASGADTGASRYWDMTFDIDQSQSFGFPDGNQPTITKYDFYFSPGPGKRLRNGKTFVNETQSTLDAHP